jgi:hypothetical protein
LLLIAPAKKQNKGKNGMNRQKVYPYDEYAFSAGWISYRKTSFGDGQLPSGHAVKSHIMYPMPMNRRKEAMLAQMPDAEKGVNPHARTQNAKGEVS